MAIKKMPMKRLQTIAKQVGYVKPTFESHDTLASMIRMLKTILLVYGSSVDGKVIANLDGTFQLFIISNEDELSLNDIKIIVGERNILYTEEGILIHGVFIEEDIKESELYWLN